MKIERYLGLNCAYDLDLYLNERYVNRAYHDEFPLCQLTYGQKTVFDQKWDDVTTRCRGVIYNAETREVIARPFEKFFNIETTWRPETLTINLPKTQPILTEKVDGSLGILYHWNGIDYIASKGSFKSEQAKWATKWYHRNVGLKGDWPKGYTPIFEMIYPENRIVIDYEDAEELILLALINVETGEELTYTELVKWADVNNLDCPTRFDATLEQAYKECVYNKSDSSLHEGFVASWPQPGKPPLRVKIKTTEYFRLHAMLSQTSPKRILEYLREGLEFEIDYLLTESTPWMREFVSGWVQKLECEFENNWNAARVIFNAGQMACFTTRKEWALFFTKPEHKKYAPVLFHWLDDRDKAADECVWNLVEPLVKAERPMLEDAE